MIEKSLAQPSRTVPVGEQEDLEHLSTIVPRAPRSTREYRVDHEFLGLLNEDFGIDFFSLNRAFMGVPPAPKRQAIAVCEWAIRAAKGDAEEAGRALRAWAKKNGTGQYDRRLLEAPEITYEQSTHERALGYRA